MDTNKFEAVYGAEIADFDEATQVARLVRVEIMSDESTSIEAVTLWEPWGDPVVTRMILTSTALSMMWSLLSHVHGNRNIWRIKRNEANNL